MLLLLLFALGVNLGEKCDMESTDPCETNAICDDYGICSKYVAVPTFCLAFNIPTQCLTVYTLAKRVTSCNCHTCGMYYCT